MFGVLIMLIFLVFMGLMLIYLLVVHLIKVYFIVSEFLFGLFTGLGEFLVEYSASFSSGGMKPFFLENTTLFQSCCLMGFYFVVCQWFYYQSSYGKRLNMVGDFKTGDFTYTLTLDCFSELAASALDPFGLFWLVFSLLSKGINYFLGVSAGEVFNHIGALSNIFETYESVSGILLSDKGREDLIIVTIILGLVLSLMVLFFLDMGMFGAYLVSSGTFPKALSVYLECLVEWEKIYTNVFGEGVMLLDMTMIAFHSAFRWLSIVYIVFYFLLYSVASGYVFLVLIAFVKVLSDFQACSNEVVIFLLVLMGFWFCFPQIFFYVNFFSSEEKMILSLPEGSSGLPSPILSLLEGSSGLPSPILSLLEGSSGLPSPILSLPEGSKGLPSPTLSLPEGGKGHHLQTYQHPEELVGFTTPSFEGVVNQGEKVFGGLIFVGEVKELEDMGLLLAGFSLFFELSEPYLFIVLASDFFLMSGSGYKPIFEFLSLVKMCLVVCKGSDFDNKISKIFSLEYGYFLSGGNYKLNEIEGFPKDCLLISGNSGSVCFVVCSVGFSDFALGWFEEEEEYSEVGEPSSEKEMDFLGWDCLNNSVIFFPFDKAYNFDEYMFFYSNGYSLSSFKFFSYDMSYLKSVYSSFEILQGFLLKGEGESGWACSHSSSFFISKYNVEMSGVLLLEGSSNLVLFKEGVSFMDGSPPLHIIPMNKSFEAVLSLHGGEEGSLSVDKNLGPEPEGSMVFLEKVTIHLYFVGHFFEFMCPSQSLGPDGSSSFNLLGGKYSKEGACTCIGSSVGVDVCCFMESDLKIFDLEGSEDSGYFLLGGGSESELDWPSCFTKESKAETMEEGVSFAEEMDSQMEANLKKYLEVFGENPSQGGELETMSLKEELEILDGLEGDPDTWDS